MKVRWSDRKELYKKWIIEMKRKLVSCIVYFPILNQLSGLSIVCVSKSSFRLNEHGDFPLKCVASHSGQKPLI